MQVYTRGETREWWWWWYKKVETKDVKRFFLPSMLRLFPPYLIEEVKPELADGAMWHPLVRMNDQLLLL